jgi:predicted kinase
MEMREHLDRHALILLMGVAGTGKSTIGARILERLCLVYLDNNFIADAFFSDTRVGADYTSLRPRMYDALYRVTEENLRVKNAVLLDAPHVTHMQRPQWQAFITNLVGRTSSNLVVLRCHCTEETLLKRLQQRNERRDEWKFANWNEFKAKEPMLVAIPFEHADLNTEEAPAANTEVAIDYIRSRTRK